MLPDKITYTVYFALATLTFFTTIILTYTFRHIAPSMGWVDNPDGDRKIHKKPIPVVGGFAMLGALSITSLLLFMLKSLSVPSFQIETPSIPIILSGTIIAVAGIWDDLFHLSFKKKFVVQIIATTVIVLSGIRINTPLINDIFSNPTSNYIISTIFTFIWVVGIINAMNLIDGKDGLAGGLALISFFIFTTIYVIHGNVPNTPLVIMVCAALIGFMHFNYYPATIFMGDTGSLFIGFILALYSIPSFHQTSGYDSILLPSLIITVPVLDTLTSFTRRLILKKPLFHPDRGHIHHRLFDLLKHSHRDVVIALYLIQLLCGISAVILSLTPSLPLRAIIVTTIVIGLGTFLYVLGYFKKAE